MALARPTIHGGIWLLMDDRTRAIIAQAIEALRAAGNLKADLAAGYLQDALNLTRKPLPPVGEEKDDG